MALTMLEEQAGSADKERWRTDNLSFRILYRPILKFTTHQCLSPLETFGIRIFCFVFFPETLLKYEGADFAIIHGSAKYF